MLMFFQSNFQICEQCTLGMFCPMGPHAFEQFSHPNKLNCLGDLRCPIVETLGSIFEEDLGFQPALNADLQFAHRLCQPDNGINLIPEEGKPNPRNVPTM